MRSVIVLAAFVVGCAASANPSDAWSADGGLHGCHWIDPPFDGVCDGAQENACFLWAIQLTEASDLVSYAECHLASTGATCVPSTRTFPGDGGYQFMCGSGPGCGARYACGRYPGETEPSCVRCER